MIKTSISAAGVALLSFGLLGIQGCGGGGNTASTPGSSTIALAGIAATGAPMAAATVQIYSADGVALLQSPATVAADGSYSASIPATAKFPLIIIADDGSTKLLSVVAEAGATATANVNQLTNLIAARLSPTGDPTSLISEIAAKLATISSSTLASKNQEMLAAIKPLLDALNLSANTNPQTVSFAANGTGFDKLLDSLDVKIEPKGSSSTIDLTLRKAVKEGEDLPNVSFSSAASYKTLPAVNANELATDGLSVKLQALLDQMTSCYALDKTARTSNTAGTAADITAAQCKAIFYGNNPAAYKLNGSLVKSDQHFGGIFTANPGVKFISPKYYYTVLESVANGPTAGDVVFGYRWQDDYGNFQYEKNVARLDPSDNQYRIIGNQYRYPGGVSPYAQRREFPKDAAYTYDSVGYVFDLPCNSYTKNWVKVVITTPPYNDAGDQGQITMKPNVTGGGVCNFSYFTLSKDAVTPSTTGFIRVQSKFAGTAPVVHPKFKEGAFLFFVDDDFSDAQIEKLPQFGTWKFDYYFADNTISATQYYKTTARARTVDGFKKSVPLPSLKNLPTVSFQTQNNLSLVANSVVGYFTPLGDKVDLTWSVASDSDPYLKGSEPATYRARIYGFYGNATTFSGNIGRRNSYEDSALFRSSARSGAIFCGEKASEPQCDNGLFKTTPAPTVVTDIDLISRINDGSDASHFYAFRNYSN
ncbi:hypothetical protein B9Z38_01150 [Limnohabitans sp. MMS-10A-160]|uniref:hypothetical protein n=1 Tax=unclassified Limnohabitans TaxID=2626134 RepID=UPI000D37E983|nr:MULTISPECIES: hypothetical protein [unclassified Limnohabitans]PUE21877.1 hypothetical protein B9Z43_01475 [Limnohabitans sp. MMS-10A-192]PUE26947.1 hypothetical protein B9Z38_01150 [Limnohabitans sp. MMS-10A-160]